MPPEPFNTSSLHPFATAVSLCVIGGGKLVRYALTFVLLAQVGRLVGARKMARECILSCTYSIRGDPVRGLGQGLVKDFDENLDCWSPHKYGSREQFS